MKASLMVYQCIGHISVNALVFSGYVIGTEVFEHKTICRTFQVPHVTGSTEVLKDTEVLCLKVFLCAQLYGFHLLGTSISATWIRLSATLHCTQK